MPVSGASRAAKQIRRGSADGNPGGGGGGGVDAGQSTCTATTPVTTGTNSTVTVTAKGSGGSPLSGQTVTLAVSGSNNTINNPSSTTDVNGVATGSFASTTAETKTVTATAGGVVISQQPSVVVTSTPAADFVEDWSEYANNAALTSNSANKYTSLLDGSSDGNETSNAAQLSLDTSQGLNAGGYSLSQCMLYSFPSINSQDYSIGCNIKLPSDQNECWVEIWAKFSSNFTTNGPAAGNADYKFNAARVRTAGRYMTFCGTYGDGWQFGTPASDQGANSDTTVGGTTYYGNSDYPFTSSVAVWDGTWHRYRYHLKNSASGKAIFYIDNFKMPSFPNVNTSGGGAIYSWALGRNMNKGTSSTMTLRWGRFAMWFAGNDPGWGF